MSTPSMSKMMAVRFIRVLQFDPIVDACDWQSIPGFDPRGARPLGAVRPATQAITLVILGKGTIRGIMLERVARGTSQGKNPHEY
jgi:hypothetical protein